MLSTNSLPAQVPELNQGAWIELAHAASNLNQIAFRLNSGESVEIFEVLEQLETFRASLLGAAL
jgi:hypothetical protein